MKKNASAQYDSKYADRIEELTRQFRQKGLSREERQAVLEELNWTKFRADSRPALSLRRFKLLDAMVYLGDTAIFGYIGVTENLKKSGHMTVGDIFMAVTAVLLIISVFVYLHIHSKYKMEPADELAHRNMLRATNWAFYAMMFTFIAAAYIYFIVSGDGSMTLKNNTLLQLVCAVMFFHGFLSDLIFVYLDRSGEDTEEEA